MAEQVDKDIKNALDFLNDEGFLVLHDCNPPSEFHAREEYNFIFSPAKIYWNGTVWKAFYKQRLNNELSCACIDSDWGVGIITKNKIFDTLKNNFNPYYDFKVFEKFRKESLNLMDFETFCKIVSTFEHAK